MKRHGSEDEEVVVARVPGRIAAEPVLAALRGSGIDARARGEAVGQIYALTMDGMGEMSILVRAADAERAKRLLEAADLGELRLGDDPSREE